jgi:hypothetical protein
MLWIIYTLWIMLGVICGVLSARKRTDLPVGLWLCSAIIMFYVPFIIGV